MGRVLRKAVNVYALHHRRGFLLSELLASLLIISLLVPITVLCLRLSMNAMDFDENVQDEIASAQLRQILSLSYEIKTDGNALYLTYLGRSMRIIYGNGHVYMTPGTNIFYSNLDDAWFLQEGNIVYVCIQRKQEVQKIALATSF